MTADDPVGRIDRALAGRYRIERPLGEGGMATVYLAADLKHHRQLALKVMHPELAVAFGIARAIRDDGRGITRTGFAGTVAQARAYVDQGRSCRGNTKELGVARVYISSTYQDLKDHREAVYVALRRLGHHSVAVDEWAATDQPPVDRSLADIRASDVAVFLVAWRYGHIPAGAQYSVTELTYRAAREAGVACLVFMTADDAPWPHKYFDHDTTSIKRFRQLLLEQNEVALFDTPETLAAQVAVSLYLWVASGAREVSPTSPDAVLAAEAPGPEVFLSYAHEDVDVAESISERIAREKWSVFWDRTIPVGFTWDAIVEGAIDASKCVVVLWSPAARNSEWVRLEAAEGAERRILAPALIAETKIPLRFRQIQAADLIGWSPQAPDTPGMQALLAAIRRCLEGKAPRTA